MAGKYWWEDDEKQSDKQTTTQSNTQTGKKYWWEDDTTKSESGGNWWDDGNIAKVAGTNIVNRVNGWLKNHNTYISDYQKRFEGRKGNYEDAYVSDSADWLTSVTQRKDSLKQEAQSILDYVSQYKDYFDPTWVSSITKTLSDATQQQKQIITGATKDHEYWSSFGSEDAYKSWQTDRKQYATDLEFDVSAGETKLEGLRAEREAYLAEQEEKRKKAQEDESFWDSLGRWLGTTPDTTLPLGGASSTSGNKTTNPYDSQISELEKQIERSKYVQGYEGYMANINASDYVANSQYASTRTDVAKEDALYGMGEIFSFIGAEGDRYDVSKLFYDPLHDYINKHEDALSVASVNDTVFDAYFLGFDKGFLQTMTDEEIGVYNYIYNTQGKESANAFLSFIENDLEGRRRIQEQAKWAAYAEEDPVGSSVFSVLTSPLKSFTALGQVADYMDDGTIDQNAGYNRFSNMSSSIRNQVASDIAKSGDWGEVGSWTYQLGMSMGDFLMNTAITGGNSAMSLTLMGSSAMADTVISAKDRGLSDDQAMILGVVAGAAEVITEKFSLDALFNGNLSKGAMRYILTNAFTEGAEEVGSSLINTIADVLVAKDKSQWEMAVKDYMAKNPGATEQEAFQKVLGDNLMSLGLDFLGGALMGGAMGGGGATINYATNARPGLQVNKDAVAQYGDYVGDLIQEGLLSDPNSESYDLAQYYQKKTSNGKTLTGYEIRNLVDANDAQFAVENYNEALPKAEKRLSELGETKDVSKIAKLVAKRVSGQQLTPAEKSILVRSQFGAQVAKEMIEVSEQTESVTKPFDKTDLTYKPLEDRVGTEARFGVSEDGQATIRVNGKAFDFDNAEVVEVGDGQISFKREDGGKVSAGGIDFADDDQSYLVSAVSDIEHITPTAATAILHDIVDTAKPLGAQLNGIDEAYTYGYNGYPEADLKAGDFTSNLTREQMMRAYDLGKDARKSGDADADAPRIKMRTEADAKLSKKEKVAKQKARFESDDVEVYFMDGKSLTKFEDSGKYKEMRMAAVNYAKLLSKMGIGGKYYFFESYVKGNVRVYKDANGNEVKAPNGIYKSGDGSIYIDLNAGDRGQGTTLFTLSHELTHFIKDWSKAKFKVLADFLIEEYDKTDMSMHKRVLAKQKFLESVRVDENGNKVKVTYDEAFEEVVADAMSTMLSDGNLHEKLAKLKAQDKSLFDKIKEFFENLIAKFQALYKDIDPEQQDARDVRAMKDSFDRIQQAFAEALVEASENYQASEQVLSDAGIAVNAETESGSLFSVRDVLSENDRKKVAKALADRFNVTETEAMDWLKAETSLASLILNPKYSAFLDYEADPDEVAIKQNSDYPQGTVDFSNICKKRREFTQVMNRILRNFPNHVFAATDLAKIRTIMGEEGMTLPCGICYVEDRRQLDSIVAQDFIDGLKLYREGSKTRPDGKPFNANQIKGLQLTDGDTYIPTIYELVTLEGRNALKAKNPNMEAAWVKYNNARGMQAVRLLTNEAEYKRQILKYTPKTVQTKNDYGGLRIYSFSDAEMFHLIDIVQVLTDCAAVGLKVQGYTKVNEYAKAVKDTGEKLNRSLIPLGDLGYHIENGKVVLDYDTVEGIDINSEDFFDSKDNPNVGNIVIGINPTQIRAAMVSDFIDYIIPFHTGQSAEVLGEKGIAAWVNYKDSQSEVDLATGKKSAHQINIYTEVFQAAEKEGKPIRNKRDFVNKFLAVCKENGLRPRFAEFLNTDANGDYVYTEGYHKFLVDFKTFAQTEIGEYLPQMPVKPIFDDAYITGLLESYVEEQQVKDAEVAKHMPKVIERITNEIVKPEQDTRYSIRNEFRSEIDKWNTDGRANDETFILGSTGDVIQGLGAIESDIYMLGEKINTILSEHSEITLEEIKKIPQILENPILILESKNTGRRGANTRMVVFGSVKAKNGLPVTTILDLRPVENHLVIDDMQKVTSAYTKDNNPVEFVKSSNVLYADKKRTAKLLRSIGFQMPIELQDSGFVGSIAYTGRKVNMQGVPFTDIVGENSKKSDRYSDRDSTGKQLTKEQQEYFASSVVRDADGHLMVMYHGTANGGAFTVFDGDQLDNSSLKSQIGQGFYFTNVKKEAESYMKNVDIYGRVSKGKNPNLHQVYLNITNPFDINADKLDLEKVKAVYMDGTSNHFFDSFISHYLNNKTVNGRVFTKSEVRAMSKADRVSLYVDYMAQIGTKELLSNMVQAFSYGKQSELLTSMQNRLGYDGIVEEYAPGKYQYVAFSSEQIKNVDNANPTSNPDIRYSDRDYVAYDRTAILKEDTVDRWLRDYASKSSPNYAQMYIAYIDPRKFLDLTTAITFRHQIERDSRKLDAAEFADYTKDQPIFLQIDHETGEVTGHEGRHRCVALIEAGIYKVPVLLADYSNKYTKKPIDSLTLTGQKFRDSRSYASVNVADIIPLSYANRDEIINRFATQSSRQRVGEQIGFNKTLRYSERDAYSKEKPRSAQAQRDQGYMLSENKFYQFYSAHKLTYGNRGGAIDAVIEKIKRDGFISSTSIANVLPTSSMRYFDYDQNGNVKFANVVQSRYAPKKGDYVLFVPNSEITKDDIIKNGFKPLDYEVGIVEYDYQPYYEVYTKAYKESQTRYSERGDGTSNRTLLANAFESITQNSNEYKLIQEYKNRIKLLNEQEEKLSKLNAEIREIRFGTTGPRDTARLAQLEAEAKNTAQAINRQDKKLLSLEASEPLRKVIERERKKEAQKTKDHVKEIQQQMKESAAVKEKRAIVEKAAKALMNMLAHPTKDLHVPTALHKPLEEFLESIDFSSKTQLSGKGMTIRDVDYTRALTEVRAAIAGQRSAMDGVEDGTFELDIPDSFLKEIDDHIRAINSATKGLDLTTNRVYEMSSDELADLGYMLKTINKAIRQIDKLHMAGAKARVSQLGQDTRLEMSRRKPVKGESGGKAMWANYTPWHAFRRMGKAAQQIFKGLMQGQSKLARTIASVIQFTEKTYTDKEAKVWEHKRHTIKLDSGKTITMTPAQIMSFYCLSKREHAKGHMMGGGIRISTIQKDAQGRELVQKEHYTLTEKDIVNIISHLTDRQIAVAEALQQYMQNVGGRLNNEISMARWDYMAATEDNYFPIKTDDSTRDVRDPGQEKSNLWALLNKSFTKGLTPGANNAMVVDSIFDVFADHMSEVAEYNAFALPLVDAMKWFNYRERIKLDDTHIKDVGVQKSIRDALGTSAVKYFVDLMTDINSSQKAGRHENLAGKILSRSKVASVGWNLRVAIQQPTAILRASLVLDMPSLLKGTIRIGTKKLVKEMQQYSGIALWKSMGYYDLNVSRSVREQIKGDDSLMDKFNELGMWLPGKMDEMTWARIWAATKAKVAKEQKLTGEELLQATAELFEEVVYQTQVADSVLTRSSLMRSKTQFMKEATSFMAEPTASVNILLSAFQDYEDGHTTWDKAKRGLMIGFYGYALSAVANAIATSLMDAWRDDDEYEEYWEKFQQALLGEKNFFDGNLFSELNPLEKIVFVKDFISLMKGYDVAPGYADLFKSAIDLVTNIKNFMECKGSLTGYGIIYQSLQVIGSVAGFGASNIAREVAGIWNNTFGKLYPDMMLHRYDAGAKAEIRSAYDTGALTAQEAMQMLIDNGIVENEDEAYWEIQKWDNGSDYSKYEPVFKAVRNGQSIDEAMQELLGHGYTEKDVRIQIKSRIGKWYQDTEITKQQAIDMLIDYTDLDEEDAANKITYWDFLKSNHNCDLSESRVLKYLEFAEPAHISLEMYERFVAETKDLADIKDKWGDVEVSKREQVLDVINSLPISWQQKDALYLAAGYSESKIWDVPW